MSWEIPNLVAITTCVDYLDWLRVTVPYNRHHFSKWFVVTCSGDSVLDWDGVREYDLSVFVSNEWKLDEGLFRKWNAIQDFVNRCLFSSVRLLSWVVLLDADILWPKEIKPFSLKFGCLYVPVRRNMESWKPGEGIPDEDKWVSYNVHSGWDWSGYTQIFHSVDPVIVRKRWFSDKWNFADGGDVEFANKWPLFKRKRTSFEVLHLGRSGRFTGRWRGPRRNDDVSDSGLG